jgi:hypothetical protein
VIDTQLQELNNKSIDASSELLICIESLHPKDLIFAFDKEKFISLA